MNNRAAFVVLSNPAPGRAAELGAWYRDVRLPDARLIPGVVTARLYERRPVDGKLLPPHAFMAVYELDGDPDEVWAEFDRRIAAGVMSMSDAVDPTSLAFSTWAPPAESA
jgi:hypothetical protein